MESKLEATLFYTFPANLTLDEVTDVIARHNEALGVTAFVRADKGEYVVFNYVVSFDGSFPVLTGDPVRDREVGIIRECRGLTFYKDTGEVAIRKFHKFFNVNQKEETQSHLIDWSQPHVILSKADGSMISPYLRRDGVLEWHTKMGMTDVALPVNDFASRHPKYAALAARCRELGVTPLFEWCSRKQKIVIDYPEDMLILLATRDNCTGEYAHYDELVRLGDEFGVPVIGHIEGCVTDPQAFLEAVRVLENEEGYIVRFDNGHMVKAKAEDYLRLHNMVDMLQLEKNVLGLVLSGTLDDYKPFMSDDSRDRVERYVEALDRGIAAFAAEKKTYADRAVAAVGDDKKRLATEWVNVPGVDQRDRQFIFRMAAGGDPVEVVKSFLVKKFVMVGPEGSWQNIGTATKVDEARDLIGGVRWDDFRDTTIVIED